MNQIDTVRKLLIRNYGYLTTRKAQAEGVDRWALSRMVEQGVLVRAAQGLYVDQDVLPDPFIMAQHRCNKGIFSHETALFLHDLSDRVPLQLMMTIPSGWNCSLLKDLSMMFFYCKPSWYGMGLRQKQTNAGPWVQCYDMERTICDCVRALDRLDRDIVLTALKNYMKHNEADKARLMEYAQVFGIRTTIYQYMEVLS